ncbi:uncharacterized protein F5Z01DRAFT_648317 [Emericellopsis atlantica]|uniref:TMEM205-like domain-containing protein n=1 Tax=Emericellopsis atlantica TaxID=2614577 RepID=A0A9P8CSJ8_9HYPO|nr:uncharacterized protein F5Z01DRAFT_648317 [Emericellopsis atlantica]KAG9257280.1 hypothetical protein F5Z01DRAFT_648317 [Emericellopsis atlantica]
MASSIFFSVAPYHIITYGTLLGTSFFHSFINGPVMFKTVERPVFSSMQQALFPIYFGIQTAAPVLMALTFPGNALFGLSSGVQGLVNQSQRYQSLLPMGVMFVTGVTNLFLLLPLVTGVMKERRGQAKRDGKEWDAAGPHSDEMQALNKRFGMLHGISSLLNLGTLIAAVAYGFTLGGRIQSITDRAA